MKYSRSKRFMTAAFAVLFLIGAPATAIGAETTTPAMPAPTPAPEPVPAKELPAPKISEDQAFAALREFFTVPEKRPNLDYQAHLVTEGKKQIWRIEASYREGNSGMGFTLGAVDAMTGRILQFAGLQMLPRPIRTGTLTNVKSREDALARAEALLKKVVPDRFGTLREGGPWGGGYYYYGGLESQGDVYNFTFVEYVNGVPFPSSSVTVGVHKQTLEYVSLQVGLQDGLTFQPGPAKVTPEEALKVYQTEVTPKLSYQTMTYGSPYGYTKPGEVKLIYTMDNMWRAVDAMTGKWAEEPNYYPRPGEEKDAPEPEPVPAGDVTPIKASTLPLTQVEARTLASLILDIPAADLRVDNDMFAMERLHRFSFYDQNSSATVQLDPKTGLIRNAWRNSYSPMSTMPPKEEPQAEPAVTPEMEAQAKQAAMTVVQTYFSQVATEMLLASPDPYWSDNPQQQVRQFRFIRRVNGLDVPNDSIYMTIDLTTMKWRDMSANLTTGVTFPDPAGVVPAEKAREAVLSGREAVLIYRPVYPEQKMEGPYYYGPMPQPTEAQLVYVLKPEAYSTLIDALTGEPVAWDGYSMTALQDALAKVEGHWAEGEFQYFLNRQTIRPGQLDPEGTLTRSLAVSLLLARTSQYEPIYRSSLDMPFKDLEEHDAYGLVLQAWNQGWLSPMAEETSFRPDAPVTRAEFAVWAVRALGYGALARSESLITRDAFSDMADLTVEQRNAVNFLSALGLLGPADGFRGADAMTQAEGVAFTARIFNHQLATK